MRKVYFYLAVFVITLTVGLAGTFLQPDSNSVKREGSPAAGPAEELNVSGEMGYELNLSGEIGYETKLH